jgi:hypothetical protein
MGNVYEDGGTSKNELRIDFLPSILPKENHECSSVFY